MGILDVPAVLLHKVGADLTKSLDNQQRNLNVLVITDSTGQDTVEQGTGSDRRWPYLLAQLIGADFPAMTVQHRQWNATSVNFDAATVIQTGNGTNNAGGPFTLTFWNAAKSGATAAYWNGNLLLLAPVFSGQGQPAYMDLILIADGHNEVGTSTGMRAVAWAHTRALQQLQPGVPIAWVTQNPQNGAGSSSSAAEQANQLLRMEEVRRLCRSEGWGLIDVQPAFLADASYATDLLNADGVHPNAAGSVLWAATAKQHFPKAREKTGTQPGGPFPKHHRIWVPATAFYPSVGTPTQGVAADGSPVWNFANGADGAVATTLDWPAGWRTTNLWLLWVQATAQANNWRVRLSYRKVGGTFEPSTSAGQSLGAPTAGSFLTVAGRSSANNVGIVALASNIDSVTGWAARPMMFQVERVGNDGADVLTVPVSLLGMFIERAS